MTPEATPPGAPATGGVSRLRATIIACACNDDSACIMCYDCGHVFADNKPLTGESQPVDNVTLANALLGHMCAFERGQQGSLNRHGR